ncbi:hypothetical protein [Thalassorhabdomicrobium marinisediminis]|uniref:YCII-related domain-containing protein n=1 Tax=Thalassorhabdomicrobium marinisediminis TaxID=2170577 RepID=A0A2T7FVN8_9RHOB|nr:hypothetical protein [Thalassorhabdomicrobium marinisediminis]PVA06218.1 hypothetical protein DC363_09905 [Thalassorhabdomicrobium marinisediminis]
MAKFLLIYHGGGMPETPEEGEKAMAAWGEWYQGMGDAVVDPGAPVGKSHTVSADGHVENGGANPVSGYTVLSCDSYEAACAHAAKNPMVKDGSGSVEVAEMMEM